MALHFHENYTPDHKHAAVNYYNLVFLSTTQNVGFITKVNQGERTKSKGNKCIGANWAFSKYICNIETQVI